MDDTELSFIAAAAAAACCLCPGWIIELKQPSCDGPEWIQLSQWVAERLAVARNLEYVGNNFLLINSGECKACSLFTRM